MKKRNDIISRIEREYATLGLTADELRRCLDALRKLDDPRREMDAVAHMYAASRGRRRPEYLLSRVDAIDLIKVIAALHDMDVDAEAMVARAEAETHPLGLTVIEGGGGGSPPSATPAGGSPAPATPPAAA